MSKVIEISLLSTTILPYQRASDHHANYHEQAVAQQRVMFTALLQNLGQASSDEIEKVMAQREQTTPERGLSPKIIRQLRRHLTWQNRITPKRKGAAGRRA
jgi:hypothetical protein